MEVAGIVTGRCETGLCLLVGISREDTELIVKPFVDRILNMRIFNDDQGKMNLSLLQLREGGHQVDLLVISNFTVYGNASKSRRPSFIESAGYENANTIFSSLLVEFRAHGFRAESGEFGADMKVTIVNDGPVTLMVEI